MPEKPIDPQKALGMHTSAYKGAPCILLYSFILQDINVQDLYVLSTPVMPVEQIGRTPFDSEIARELPMAHKVIISVH